MISVDTKKKEMLGDFYCEHRFFCHISRVWRGKVFKDVVGMLMRAVKEGTRTGLPVSWCDSPT